MVHLHNVGMLAPCGMVAGLLLGLAAALGHHLFNHSLDGTVAPEGNYTKLGLTLNKQQTNLAVGTAFGFVVKAALIFTVALAYTQLFWNFAKSTSNKKGIKLLQLDTTSSALTNLISLLSLPSFRSQPLLLLLAAVAWFLPIASIVTSATLTVTRSPILLTPVIPTNVTTLDFRSFQFSAPITGGLTCNNAARECSAPEWTYNGPDRMVTKIAENVALEGSIATIPFNKANASWTIEFFGPSLKCRNATERQWNAIVQPLQKWVNDGCNDQTPTGCFDTAPTYLSWWHQASDNDTSSPFVQTNQTNHTSGTMQFSQGQRSDVLRFYMAMIPGMLENKWDGQFDEYRSILLEDLSMVNLSNTTVLTCDLLNATYRVDFDYVDSIPDLKVTVDPINATEVLRSASEFIGPGLWGAAMSTSSAPNCTRLMTPDQDYNNKCFWDDSIIWRIAYQSVVDSFVSLISGQVTSNGSDSLVKDTVLTNTKELSYLNPDPSDGSEFIQTINSWADGDPSKLGLFTQTIQSNSTTFNTSIFEAIEQLFQNITVSLMSVDDFRPNPESIRYPKPVDVTTPEYHNVYIYSAKKLWMAYGIAIGITTVCLAVGFIAILINGASYSDNFSTIFRAARGADLSEEVRSEDCDGKDPLPAYLEETKVRFKAVNDAKIINDYDESSDRGSELTRTEVGSVAPTTSLLRDR